MVNEVTEIKQKLYRCVPCGYHWATAKRQPKCPKCKSTTVVRDELHMAPSSHTVYSCHCGNNLFKRVRDDLNNPYCLCIKCGQWHDV